MDINISSFADLSLDRFSFNLSYSFDGMLDRCSRYPKGISIITAFSTTNILVMFPLSVIVFYLGFRQWRQGSNPTASPSDVFTYNMVAMVLIEVMGCVIYCVGGYANISDLVNFLYDFFCNVWSMKMQFHMLTCAERYVAVVHPVTYLGLKSNTGVRIRKFCIGCIWLQFVILIGLIQLTTDATNLIIFFCHLIFAFIVISYCSVSVLCALSRPGPGEVGGDREQVDQTKQRAFHTITAIMGTLLFSLGGVLVCTSMYASMLLSYTSSCMVMMSFVWFSLPSSLVLPLLYLHRAGKLPSCTKTNESP